MSFALPLPDWMPGWVPIALLVPALLYLLAFLFMPFSVIGVKTRLEALEARLDELQGELRSLTLRLPEPTRGPGAEEFSLYAGPAARREAAPQAASPPIPPPPLRAGDPGAEPRGQFASPGRPVRAEPRLDWPH
ncbi:MAG: hypothetical protein LGL72_17505 [Acidibrevibacterium sp.]|jgi:hypothetical protein|uniref:hypothetical protein n=1 Tax=Acidibrevibacterium fodinaquatile TaxID=1969806 RepID=UPI0023A86752|nr:hypothetical protein [Acidibrevibacterium fodinaquatile]MCA7121146.1 hypothetical protein [Acidibrevibacterium fodinaquatile]